jgi:hypothetical protein
MCPGRWLCALALTSLALSARALELTELTGLLAEAKSGAATFVEQRFVRGLPQPLRASGTLSFTAPDRFTRQTLEPRAEGLSVEGNAVTLTRNGRTRRMALDSLPEMAAVVEAIRGTLVGDAAALQRLFRLTVGGDLGQWELHLMPQDARLAGRRS